MHVGWLAGLALVPVSLLLADAEPGIPRQGKEPDTSTASCKSCHGKYHEEWKDTTHAKAWTDPLYQEWIKAKRNPKSCYPCHIPQSVLDRAPKKPRTRTDNLDDGINCASCHVQGGKVLGPYGAKTDAHVSVKSKFFADHGNVDLCLSCHSTGIKPILPIGRDFTKAKLNEQGKSCRGCHMPELERHIAWDPKTGKPTGPKRKARSHKVLGPKSDPAFLAKAFEFNVVDKDGHLTLSLANATGHRVPGVWIRSFRATLEVVDKAGKVLWSKKRVFDRKNPLPVLESWSEVVAKPAGTHKSRATVHHWFEEEKDKGQKDQGVVFKVEK